MSFLFEVEGMSPFDPFQTLGVEPEAGPEEIRAAYLRKVKEFPPDRAPREFERLREAYEILSDPRRRARHLVLAADPRQPLASLLEDLRPARRHVGPGPWLAVLEERQS
jgi:curved DNA-binding protein CbpA